MKAIRYAQIILVLASNVVAAQVLDLSTTEFGFDCWIGNEGKPYFTSYIRCIADRDLPQAPNINPQAEELLERMHRELHDVSGAAAEKMFKANLGLAQEARAVWNIRIYSYPYEWSWQEGRPEQLVRAVLCPPNKSCNVMIRSR